MSWWNAKYKNVHDEYEITFASQYYEKTKLVEKLCQAIIDKKINIDNATNILERLIKGTESLRPKGEWIEGKVKNFYGYMITVYECTNCKKHSIGQNAIAVRSDFCPNCGADMRSHQKSLCDQNEKENDEDAELQQLYARR